MAQLLTRINYGLIIGNFEMDFSDGEVRYKTSADLRDVELIDGVFGRLVFANVRSMDRYTPAIHAMAAEGSDPDEALRACGE